MVDGVNTKSKQQSSANNKSFNDQNQAKIVLRRLPPTFTSEQFLENVSPLPDHDYYRFCKADLSFGQQYAFSRAYLNIPNRQDLIVFTEKFQGYVFVDKNGNEYPCSVEYAPNQSRPKSEQQSRKDPKMNSIEQDPEYQTFVANMNTSESLPNAETMLEEIEKKQRDIQDTKNKVGVTTTPLLEFLKRKREERKQEKNIRLQTQQRRNNKQLSRNNEDEYNSSQRYGGGDRSNRQQRGYDKSDYRDQKRSNDYGGNKPSKNRDHQNPKPKQTSKESKSSSNPKPNTEESSPSESQPKREANPADNPTENDSSSKPSSASSQKNSNVPPTKNRPSQQMYNPGEKARLRRQQPPSS